MLDLALLWLISVQCKLVRDLLEVLSYNSFTVEVVVGNCGRASQRHHLLTMNCFRTSRCRPVSCDQRLVAKSQLENHIRPIYYS
jgi:hypothetical protein